MADQFFTLKPRLYAPFDFTGHWAEKGTGAGAKCCVGAEESYFGDHLSYETNHPYCGSTPGRKPRDMDTSGYSVNLVWRWNPTTVLIKDYLGSPQRRMPKSPVNLQLSILFYCSTAKIEMEHL